MASATSVCGSAANNGTPTTPKPSTTSTLSKLKSWGKWYICGNSPEGAIENWMETGATKGAIGGAIAGAGTVGVATFGVGGVPGAALGGVVGGVVGAGAGVIWGGGAGLSAITPEPMTILKVLNGEVSSGRPASTHDVTGEPR